LFGGEVKKSGYKVIIVVENLLWAGNWFEIAAVLSG